MPSISFRISFLSFVCLSGGCNLDFTPAIAPQIQTSVVDRALLEVRFQPAGIVDAKGNSERSSTTFLLLNLITWPFELDFTIILGFNSFAKGQIINE